MLDVRAARTFGECRRAINRLKLERRLNDLIRQSDANVCETASQKTSLFRCILIKESLF